MPVWKFRRIEDVPPAATHLPAGRGLRAAIELSELCAKLDPSSSPRGVRRFRTLDEANEERAVTARVRKLRAEHGNPRRTDIVEFATRDRSSVAASKAAYWVEHKRVHGPLAGLRVTDGLRRYVGSRIVGWPSPADRDADIEVHVRVGEMLRSVGRPIRSR